MAETPVDEFEALTRHLVAKYEGTFDEETIQRAVDQARGTVEDNAEVDDFVPTFTQRRAESLLEEEARNRGFELRQVKQILFMDDHNTARSQIAAAIANGHGDGLIRARSAGVSPGEAVSDQVVQLLRDNGLEPDTEEANPLTGMAALSSDVVVTMGLSDEQKEEMPVHGLSQVDWDDLGSLENASADELRAAFDETKARVDEFIDELLSESVGQREVDPEVEKELEETISDLHNNPR